LRQESVVFSAAHAASSTVPHGVAHDATISSCRGSDLRPLESNSSSRSRLRVGDVILEDGDHFEIVGQPTGASSGKMTRALVRREGETTPYEAMWEVWRKVRLVRSTAA